MVYALTCSSLAIVSSVVSKDLLLIVYALSCSCLAIVSLRVSNDLFLIVYALSCSCLAIVSSRVSNDLFLIVSCSGCSHSYSFALCGCIMGNLTLEYKAIHADFLTGTTFRTNLCQAWHNLSQSYQQR